MKKLFFFIVLFIGMQDSLHAQSQDSTHHANLRFSLLSCDAGNDLYTIWGHTALRVIDSVQHTDIVYNYGSFDFDEPNFIAKFLKGNLRYFISADTYQNFIQEYQYYGRNVREQVLNISVLEKQKWQAALLVNMMGENRYYLYNFITDNCTTRIKDGLAAHTGLLQNAIAVPSFRKEVVDAPYQAGMPWIGLGIDLLLGAVADQAPSASQAAFLPKLLYQKLEANPAIIASRRDLYFNQTKSKDPIKPFTVLISLFIVYIFASKWNTYFTQKMAKILDISLALLLGLGGCIVVYMSQFSLHTACHHNYNVVWLHPLYLLAIPLYMLNHKWIGYLGWLFFGAICILMISSYWIEQYFSPSVMVMICIALFLSTRFIKKGQYASYQ